MTGACIGLFMLAIFERWLAAMRGVMEEHWSTRAQIALSGKRDDTSALATSTSPEERTDSSSPDDAQSRRGWPWHRVPPFIFYHDIPRGILQVATASINFLLMLAVMTFQAGFILAIVVGLGTGEALFGRYSVLIGDPH